MGEVIEAWDVGVAQMAVGQRANLFCPYQMAYGEGGYPPVIPRKADLKFDVELLAVQTFVPGKGFV